MELRHRRDLMLVFAGVGLFWLGILSISARWIFSPGP